MACVILFMMSYSLYIHIPFCQRRCGYCDFNTYAGMDQWMERYVLALTREVDMVARRAERLPVHSIYFGGGTPSFLPADLITFIMTKVQERFDLLDGAEVTLEVNPGTITDEKMTSYARAGINRISLGLQSIHPQELKALDRLHGYHEAVEAIRYSQNAGIGRVNVDLIYGIPGQSMDGWMKSLAAVCALPIDHLSLYSLTIEPGTPLFQLVAQGKVQPADDDMAADMFEYAIDSLAQAGWQHYEISNWARKQENGIWSTSRHNLQYWQNLPYLGFGAGAHGYAAGWRTVNVPGIVEYINLCKKEEELPFPFSPANSERISIDTWTEIQETMMVGLRLCEQGVTQEAFYQRFNTSLEDLFHNPINTLMQRGLVEWADGEDKPLRLTRKGRLLGNQVFMEFIDLPAPEGWGIKRQ
jgi:oxygen-independent coproporphyrinogen-3 oxidase